MTGQRVGGIDPGGPGDSPWVWIAQDAHGEAIEIDVDFDPGTLALLDANVFRQADCLYRHIYIGTGPNGRPETSRNAYAVPAGQTTITAAQLAANGLHTITDILALQITAGP
jgi:hypothetical protein